MNRVAAYRLAALRQTRKPWASAQKRFNTPYRPWPLDKYKHPGCAKYWLSKYPPTDQTQDEYEQEFIYLDELDKRVEQAAADYPTSERWEKAANEYGWVQNEHPLEAYGTIGGNTSQEMLKKYGRGNKIDPSHYIAPRFWQLDRNPVTCQYIHPDLRKRVGPLRNYMGLPPEEPSVFKLWNPYNIAGAAAVVLVSKEYFLISHDIIHACVFWSCWSLIITVGVDWATWWYALRGQESYDKTYYPLQEKVDQVFKILNSLEDRPSVTKALHAMRPYFNQVNERLMEKQKADACARANISAVEKLEAKLKEEGNVKTGLSHQFKENAFQKALKHFETDAANKAYMDAAFKMLEQNAKLDTGSMEPVKGDSTVFGEKVAEALSKEEATYIAEQKKAGTLPWVFRSEAERKKAALTKEAVRALYQEKVDAFSKKYHPVTNVTLA